MRLFSEKVSPTFTSSNLNIITVESFSEIFFDVYELEINGKKFIAEKVSEYKGSPVVSLPIVLEGKEFTAPFVIQNGKFEILFNKNNTTYVKDVVDNSVEEYFFAEEQSHDEVEQIVFEKKEDILKELNQARKSAKEYAESIKQQKIQEADVIAEQRSQAIVSEINTLKTSLVDEFISIAESVKSDLYDFNTNERSDIREFISESINSLAEGLSEDLDKKNELAIEFFNEQINSLAANILKGTLLKEIKKTHNTLTNHITEKLTAVDLLFDEHRQIVNEDIAKKIDVVNTAILNLESANVELHDAISKSSNKALSRIGNVKTQIEESISSISGRIETAEDRIRQYYDDKLFVIENQLTDTTEETKSYFINLINESRQSLLAEIANIKVDVPNIIIEKKDGLDQKIDLKSVQSALEKSITTKFTNEVMSLKRLIEMSSGGGSVAQQFANGGTMNGNLTVTGAFSASQYLGLSIPTGNYLPLSGGTLSGSLTVQGSISATNTVTISGKRAITSSGIFYIESVTQAQYDSITPDPNTFYIITDASLQGPIVLPLRTVNSDYTVTDKDYTINITTACNLTLPTAIGNNGRIYNIKNSSTGSSNLSAATGETIDGRSVITMSTQYQSFTIQSNNSNWIII